MTNAQVRQALNDPLGQELLHYPGPARLAYIGLDGAPRVVPVGFYWNGKEIVICTATIAPKVKALTANPKVALTIDTYTQSAHELLVRGTARIEIVEGVADEYIEAAKKSLEGQALGDFETQVRQFYERMARIRITPEWAKIFDFETRLPRFLETLARRQTGN